MVFDVDNTLCEYERCWAEPRIADNFSELTERFKSSILSHTYSERRRLLESMFGIPTIQTSARKPFPDAFRELWII